MSAMEILYPTSQPTTPARLHVVREGESSANSRRKAYARAMVRAQQVSVRATAGLISIAAVFATAATTLVWAFLAIPNTPLP